MIRMTIGLVDLAMLRGFLFQRMAVFGFAEKINAFQVSLTEMHIHAETDGGNSDQKRHNQGKDSVCTYSVHGYKVKLFLRSCPEDNDHHLDDWRLMINLSLEIAIHEVFPRR